MDVQVLGSGRSLLGDEDNVLNAAVRAGLSAITRAGITIKEVDCIICISSSFRPTNFTARTVKHHLGLFTNACLTEDIQVAAMSLPQKLESLKDEIRNGVHKNILVVGTDASRMRINWSLTDILPLAGEVAWAFLLGKPVRQSSLV